LFFVLFCFVFRIRFCLVGFHWGVCFVVVVRRCVFPSSFCPSDAPPPPKHSLNPHPPANPPPLNYRAAAAAAARAPRLLRREQLVRRL
jgi:hypothetical protein